MKCLNCGNEMQQGIVEGYGQGGHSCYEFTSDEEKQKKGLKGLFTKEIMSISTDIMSLCARYCSKCKEVVMRMETDE